MANAQDNVIDDSQEFLLLMQAWLESEEFEACSCSDARNAVELAAAEMPRLILIDLVMPDKPGIEVLAELKMERSTRHIPVIVLTAAPKQTEPAVTLIRRLAEESLPKPFDFEHLLSRLRYYLERRDSASLAG